MEVTLKEFNALMDALEKGEVRVAQKVDGVWQVNREVKEIILAGFRLGAIKEMSQGQFPFFDKDTFPVRHFKADDGVRIVPGGTSVRRGAYMAPGSIIMPPAYVNVGAYVDEGTMVDSHVTIGSCAQVGKHSTIVQEGAVIASGVIITSSTAIYDATKDEFIKRNADGRIVVPAGAVVVSGSKPIVRGGKPLESGVHLYCPVIVKYRDSKTEGSIHLEDLLR